MTLGKFGRLCRAVLDEVVNNPASLISISIGYEYLHPARDGIGPHPAYIFILKHTLDAIEGEGHMNGSLSSRQNLSLTG